MHYQPTLPPPSYPHPLKKLPLCRFGRYQRLKVIRFIKTILKMLFRIKKLSLKYLFQNTLVYISTSPRDDHEMAMLIMLLPSWI